METHCGDHPPSRGWAILWFLIIRWAAGPRLIDLPLLRAKMSEETEWSVKVSYGLLSGFYLPMSHLKPAHANEIEKKLVEANQVRSTLNPVPRFSE